MDLYEAFPSLANIQHLALFERNLRLISLSGLVYDAQALYFEISPEKYWGRLAGGNAAIGIGLPKVNPNTHQAPHKTLIEYLHTAWHCDTHLYMPGFALMIDEDKRISLLPEVDTPFMLQMTRPRLGGSIMPDALVQVSYLLPIKEFMWDDTHTHVDLLRISRDHLEVFLAQDMWSLSDLSAQPWCDIKTNKPLPQDALTRIVLILRSLRDLLHAENMNLDFLSLQAVN